MNSPYIFSTQLQKLCFLAQNAKNDYEKASVFSATESLTLKFLKEDSLPHIVSEKIYLMRFHINAFLGYEYTHGFSTNDHLEQAKLTANDLMNIIEKMKELDHKKPKEIHDNQFITFLKNIKN